MQQQRITRAKERRGEASEPEANITTPGFQACWKERRASFVPVFQEIVDQWQTEEPPIKRPHEMSKDGINERGRSTLTAGMRPAIDTKVG
jgi:hypothetical protein